MGRHACGNGKVTPARPAGKLGFIVAQIKQPTAPKARVLAALCAKFFPKRQALGGNRQFAGVAVLLAAPAPVTAGLLRPDQALFDQRHLQTAPGEVIGGEDTDDAAADNDGVRRCRQFRRCRDLLQRGGHGRTPYIRPNLPQLACKRCQTGRLAGISCCWWPRLQLFMLHQKNISTSTGRAHVVRFPIPRQNFMPRVQKTKKGFRT
ncbi:hypothetical protein D3C86_961910 [compost metagenome]